MTRFQKLSSETRLVISFRSIHRQVCLLLPMKFSYLYKPIDWIYNSRKHLLRYSIFSCLLGLLKGVAILFI